ncbi:MAG: efflux RND transporter periplasmic adaptor subunit [Candidatus Omnitrophica bacterium]|nr:efflux RND transporter periplasmic adaptor subunit [Candidatus Omnitrophota bacterium]
MFKRMVIMLIFVGIIVGAYWLHMMSGLKEMMKQMSGGMPPVVVSSVKVTTAAWQPTIRAVATLRAVAGVDIASEIPGLVQEILFKSGDEVKTGQVLLRFNTDTETAQLRALEAAAELAATVYERDKKQLAAQAVSQAVVDADAAELKSRKAQVDQQAALIAKKTIVAPFAGTLGISTVNQGQYLNPGEKIVTLQSLDSVFVDFYFPQQDLSRVKLGQEAVITTETYPGVVFAGKITAINPRVETESRNVLVEALIDNAKHELVPGMYVAVEINAGEPKSYLTVPQTAVTYNPYGETIFVIEESKDPKGQPALTVKQKLVTAGDKRGDQVAILDGLQEGEMAVTSGQNKLKNGSAVVIDNKVQPLNEENPKPQEQ